MITKKRKKEIKEMLECAYNETFDTQEWIDTINSLNLTEEEENWTNEHLAFSIVEK